MKKKILSLIISMVLIVGAMPAMNLLTVSAAGGTDLFALEDFENYNVGDKAIGSDATPEFKNKSGVQRIFPHRNIEIEIATGAGYDGKTTKYLKVKSTAADTASTNHNKRMYIGANSGNNFTSITGKIIHEFKFKEPTNIKNWSFGSFEKLFETPISWTVAGEKVAFKSDHEDNWVSVRIVFDNSTKKALVYINDVLCSYNEITHGNVSNIYPQFRYLPADQELYLDDIRIYHTPDATVATAAQKDATDVARTVNPTVTFNESLLDRIANSDATVTITDKTNSGTVGVENLTVSSDGKTLTIDPATDLAYGTQYEIKLNNFRDMYDVAITGDTTFTFSTMAEPKYAVTAPVFKKHNLIEGTSSAITQLENGNISCTYSITNNESEEKPVCFLVVLYENNELKQFLFKEEMLAQGATSTFSGGFTVGDAANSKIQTFIWNSLSAMVPLGSSYTLDTAGLR